MHDILKIDLHMKKTIIEKFTSKVTRFQWTNRLTHVQRIEEEHLQKCRQTLISINEIKYHTSVGRPPHGPEKNSGSMRAGENICLLSQPVNITNSKNLVSMFSIVM